MGPTLTPPNPFFFGIFARWSTYERGYFRSPGRGGKNQKIAFPFFSICRTSMIRSALERSISQDYQTISLFSKASLPASPHHLKVEEIRELFERKLNFLPMSLLEILNLPLNDPLF